jgi:signal transduction histidine kinase
MGFILGVLLGSVGGFGGFGLPLLARLRRRDLALRGTAAERDAALAREATTARLLRLSADELRVSAMTLLGHAGRLSAAAAAVVGDSGMLDQTAAIAAMSGHMLALADDLHDEATDVTGRRALHDEAIALDALLREVILAVVALVGPGTRNWQIDPAIATIVLRADRRALRQVLTRVLGNAARFTRHQDWIDITIERQDGERQDGERQDGAIVLVIADEGIGLPAAPPPGAIAPAGNSRGVGLGLTLARSLMHAHGGSLQVESHARVGTRVSLTWPADRVAAPQPVLVT